MVKRLYKGCVRETMWLGLGGLWSLQWWIEAQEKLNALCPNTDNQLLFSSWWFPIGPNVSSFDGSAHSPHLAVRRGLQPHNWVQIIQISSLPLDCDSRLWWLCKAYKHYLGTNPEAVLHRTHPKDTPLKQSWDWGGVSACLPLSVRAGLSGRHAITPCWRPSLLLVLTA